MYLDRTPEHAKAGLAAMNAGRPLTAPNTLESVLDRLETESVAQIAESYQVSEVALYRFLTRNAPEQWKDISTGKALQRIDEEDRSLESATTKIELGRARERLNQARWTLERTCRSIYGDKLTIASEINPQDRELLANASELLALFKEKVIEQEKPAIEDKGE